MDSNPERMNGKVAAALVLVVYAIVFAACPNSPPPQKLVLDTASAVISGIGTDGGTVECTAADGKKYTLTVPANALIEPAEITMTPVTSIGNLPLSGELAGAVELQPAGLQFARAAILSIETGVSAGAGQIPVGFSYEGQADTFALAPGGSDNGVLKVLVQHFSGTGVGFGTTQDIGALEVPTSPTFQSFGDRMLALAADPSHTDAAVVALMKEWFVKVILPELQKAQNDIELAAAVLEYDIWADGVIQALGLSNPPNISSIYATEVQQAAQAAAPQLRKAIEDNNLVAATQESFTAVANVLFWQQQALLFHMDEAAEHLDRATVLQSLPLDIKMDPVTLPAIQAGFPNSQDLKFSVQFHGAPAPTPAPFEVTLTATGATLQHPNGFTDAQGRYTTVITGNGSQTVSIGIDACLVLPVTPPPLPAQPKATDFCFNTTLTGGSSVDLTGHWHGDAVLVVAVTSDVIFAPMTMDLGQNQNALSGTWQISGATLPIALGGTVSGTVIKDPTHPLALVLQPITFIQQGCGDGFGPLQAGTGGELANTVYGVVQDTISFSGLNSGDCLSPFFQFLGAFALTRN